MENPEKSTVQELVEEVNHLRQQVSELKNSEEPFKLVVDRSRDGIVVVDANCKVVYANNKFAEMLGYTIGEVYDLYIWDWDKNLPKEDILGLASSVDDIEGHLFETRHTRKDGTCIDVELSNSGTFAGGKKLIFCISRDITDRKKSEEEKIKLEEQVRHAQKLKAIGTLAGGIAHDFNNILSVIIGYTELGLKKINSDTPIYSYLLTTQKASIRAKNIIQQLLMFSRKVGPKKQSLNIAPIIKETVTFLRSTIPSTINIQTKINVDNHVVHADPTQIHQVLMNLCVNAAHSIGKNVGSIKITATSEYLNDFTNLPFKELPEGDYIKISVEDNGPGIAPAIQSRIFEPYFTTRDKSKGSGMGLAVVDGIIENHGGSITVDSTLGKGTVFRLILPATKSNADRLEKQTSVIPGGTESILFVDDEKEICKIVKLILEEQGFSVQTAYSALDALNIFRKNPDGFDLVITDMTMPYFTGDELFEEIKTIRNNIPVILCTGHNDYINEEKALAMGVAAFLFKPVGNIELCTTIRNVLDNKLSSGAHVF
jgi:two-component system, cell cycle sensor histidine kinase and response regulator CckA